MQSKPNFRKSQMNANPYITKIYENKRNWTIGQSKPNSNPIKPNFQKTKMNVNLTLTKVYRKKDDFAVRKNKPNSNPISVTPKMNVNLYVIEDYREKDDFAVRKNKPNSNSISVTPKMNVNLYVIEDYREKDDFAVQKNKAKQTQFHLPQRGKTEIRCRMSEARYLSSAFCFLSSVHGHRVLAVGFSGFIHINSALCLFYHFSCLRYIFQLWDLEKFATLTAVYPSVSGTTIKQPGTATIRALSDNLHRYIPYVNRQDTLWWSRILKRNAIRNQLKTKIFYPRSRLLSIVNFLVVP